MLICSGLPKYYLSKNRLIYEDEVVYILDNSGEVIPYYESDFDKFLIDVFFENFSETWIRNPEKIIDSVVRIYNNRTLNYHVVSGGHLHTSMHTHNKLDYVFEFIEKADNIDRCLFITISTEKEYRICKKLRNAKRPDAEDTHSLEQHIDIHNSLINLYGDNDIILRFKDIFDKEYIRGVLALNIDNWKETYFDIIYDNYMRLQDKGIINESRSIQ